MIFNRFFKPKWQHNDAAVRQQAISALNPDNPEHKAVLHELAFNDGTEAVRKAALQKLNDFSLWWQASKHDSAERLQQLAEQTLISQLLENRVEPKLKQQFIAQCNRSSILEQLAQTETDAGIKFDLLQRLNKTELYVKALHDPVLERSQKQRLLHLIDDEKTLEKLSQKLENGLLADVQQKLAALQQQKQKPLQLRKQLTLFLAKFNALRDRYGLTEIEQQFAQHKAQWQEFEPELTCLGAEADEYRAKYVKICQQLSQWLEPQLAQLQKQQADQAAAEARAAKRQALQQRLDKLEEQLQQALLNTDLSAAEQLETEFVQLFQACEQADISNKAGLLDKTTALQQQLRALPKLAEQLTALTRIISDWAALSLPDDVAGYEQAAQQVKQWQQQWREIGKTLAIAIPEHVLQAKNTLEQQWRQCAGKHNAETEKLQRQCRSKLAQYRRLYQAGKYKVLFGLFKGIEQDYNQLTAQQQATLTKDFEFARDKQAELADWQEYIATPRKQELLQQLQQLSAESPSDMRQRAAAVKQARANWLSLGKADPALDTALNQAFDEACEQAFAPCRAYFAQQDALRAEHAKQREQLIARAHELGAEIPDAKTLDIALQKLKQLWQQAGAVDKQQYSDLNTRFNQALLPLQAALKTQQQQVAMAKQQLIEQAKAALLLADPTLTAKTLKSCQQNWKTLGSAGRKQDQALWLAFRAVCDGFFNARAEQLEQQKHAEQTELAQFESLLSALAVKLETAETEQQFDEVQQQLNALQPQGIAAVQAVRLVQDKLQKKQHRWQQQQQQQEISRMFTLLADPALRAEQLPVPYRDCFAGGQEQQLSRHQLTLALELIADVPSPDNERTQRQQVQLVLLSDKHNQGATPDKDSLLRRWLQFGAVTEAELSLLERVKAVFC